MSIKQWFCYKHPQEFLSNGDCRLCIGDINWQAKFEAGRKYWDSVMDKKNEYYRKKRLEEKQGAM